MTINISTLKGWIAEAEAVGLAAGGATIPDPMHIEGYAPTLGGVCGFAWVEVWPRNCPLADGLKKLGWRSSTYQGVSAPIFTHGQSLEMKAKHAEAFASKLGELAAAADPKATVSARSRID